MQYREGMANPLQPRGPEDPSVYWRRRAVVVLGALLILFVVWKVIAGSNDSPSASSQTPQATVSSPASDPTHQASAQPTESATPQTSSTPTVAAVPVANCADSDVKVSLAISKTTVAAGAGLHMTMHVVNVSSTPCKRNLGSGPNEIWITSGPAAIWSTDHCFPSQASHVITLKPKQDWSVSNTWDGHRSAKGCKDLGIAKPGAYWAHSRSGTAVGADVRFVIQ